MLFREKNEDEAVREYWSRVGEKAPGVFISAYNAIKEAEKSGFLSNVSFIGIEFTQVME
jgi:hypothetical protein